MRVLFGAAHRITGYRLQGATEPTYLDDLEARQFLACWHRQVYAKSPPTETVVLDSNDRDILHLDGEEHRQFRTHVIGDRLRRPFLKTHIEPKAMDAEAIFTDKPSADFLDRYRVVKVKPLATA